MLLPEFSIVGMGGSLNEAVENAVELFGDYLTLCARDGKTWEQARRLIGASTRLRLFGEAALALIERWIGSRRTRAGHDYLRLPISGQPAH